MSCKVLRPINRNQKQRRWNYAENICSVFNIDNLFGITDHDWLYGIDKKFKPGR
jgi:hypothetical protein